MKVLNSERESERKSSVERQRSRWEQQLGMLPTRRKEERGKKLKKINCRRSLAVRGPAQSEDDLQRRKCTKFEVILLISLQEHQERHDSQEGFRKRHLDTQDCVNFLVLN
jgi:hypothetical protein